MPSRATHWNQVHTTKTDREVSWFEASPDVSLQMLHDAGMTADSCVLDVGGGDSRLVDALLAEGLRCVTVLDVSGAALVRARARLGGSASLPTWIEADVTGPWTTPAVDLWHDRAVFHFLAEAEDRARYKAHLLDTLSSGGSAIIATFAPDGPTACSGLPVQRYSPESLAHELGPAFELRGARAHVHTTPWGSAQSFQYSWLQRRR